MSTVCGEDEIPAYIPENGTPQVIDSNYAYDVYEIKPLAGFNFEENENGYIDDDGTLLEDPYKQIEYPSQIGGIEKKMRLINDDLVHQRVTKNLPLSTSQFRTKRDGDSIRENHARIMRKRNIMWKFRAGKRAGLVPRGVRLTRGGMWKLRAGKRIPMTAETSNVLVFPQPSEYIKRMYTGYMAEPTQPRGKEQLWKWGLEKKNRAFGLEKPEKGVWYYFRARK